MNDITLLLIGAAAIAVLVLVLCHRPAARRRRHYRAELRQWESDLVLAGQWNALHAAAARPGFHIAQVIRIYAVYPRRGTKAVVGWLAPQEPTHWGRSGRDAPLTTQDTWLWKRFPQAGTWLLIRGDTGYGRHNNNPKVLYVDEVAASAPAGAPDAWKRCADRDWTAPVDPAA